MIIPCKGKGVNHFNFKKEIQLTLKIETFAGIWEMTRGMELIRSPMKNQRTFNEPNNLVQWFMIIFFLGSPSGMKITLLLPVQ